MSMSILSHGDRQILLAEYRMLHDSINRRNLITHTINSIVLPSSIILLGVAIEFQKTLNEAVGFNLSGILPLLSAILMFASLFYTGTSWKTNEFSWNRVHEIEEELGIKGHRYVYSKIRHTWWWRARTMMWAVLLLGGIAGCLFLAFRLLYSC